MTRSWSCGRKAPRSSSSKTEPTQTPGSITTATLFQTLFQAFVHEDHDLVVPIVVELIKSYSVIQSNDEKLGKQNGLESPNVHFKNTKIERYILLKDASYNCASIAAWELVSHVDFDIWFGQSLLPEIQDHNCHILIKRRILILISNWVNIKLSQENRPLCYDLLCKCLQANEDLVIRLQATQGCHERHLF